MNSNHQILVSEWTYPSTGEPNGQLGFIESEPDRWLTPAVRGVFKCPEEVNTLS